MSLDKIPDFADNQKVREVQHSGILPAGGDENAGERKCTRRSEKHEQRE